MAGIHEEEALGKAYDSRLMKRLVAYLRPYGWQVALAITTIVIKAMADVIGPVLTILAVDKYLAPNQAPHYLIGSFNLVLTRDVHIFRLVLKPNIHISFPGLTAEQIFGRWLGSDPVAGIA